MILDLELSIGTIVWVAIGLVVFQFLTAYGSEINDDREAIAVIVFGPLITIILAVAVPIRTLLRRR